MPGKKISQLPAVFSAQLTDIIPAVQAGVTVQETLGQVLTLFGTGLPYLPLAGGTMAGDINMNTNKIIGVPDPINPLDAANKEYVDAIAQGFNVLPAAYAASTGDLGATYNNGAAGIGATLTDASGTFAVFSIDGVSPPLNSNILVKDQTNTFENGLYKLTTNGDTISIPWVLTRQTFYDQPAEINPGDFVLINFGTVNSATAWIETATVVTIGTDPILFSKFGNAVAFPITLSEGGTSASLMASDGGIFYSTATQGAILAGTATARQMLQSGASSAPAWSTSTWPATTTINRILFSSANNTVSEILTALSGVLTTDGSGIPSITPRILATNVPPLGDPASSKIGTFSHNFAITGTQVITGVGFQPSLVIFMAGNGATGNPENNQSIGFDNLGLSFCLFNQNAVVTGKWAWNSGNSIFISGNPGNFATAHLTAVGADGFTITWAKTGTPTGTATVGFLAFK